MDSIAEDLKLICQYEGSAEKVTVIPRIESALSLDRILIGSFYIDSLEMAPSARLILTKENPSAVFPEKPVIFRPLFWFPRNMGSPAFYNYKAVFFKNGKEDFSITMRDGFSLPEVEYNENEVRFTLQGNPLSLRRFVPVPQEEEELRSAVRSDKKANFFLLPAGKEELWESLLAFCDTYGIAAALSLPEGMTFRDLPRELFTHPSLLFLFSTSLASGEKEEHILHPLRKLVTLPHTLLGDLLT